MPPKSNVKENRQELVELAIDGVSKYDRRWFQKPVYLHTHGYEGEPVEERNSRTNVNSILSLEATKVSMSAHQVVNIIRELSDEARENLLPYACRILTEDMHTEYRIPIIKALKQIRVENLKEFTDRVVSLFSSAYTAPHDRMWLTTMLANSSYVAKDLEMFCKKMQILFSADIRMTSSERAWLVYACINQPKQEIDKLLANYFAMFTIGEDTRAFIEKIIKNTQAVFFGESLPADSKAEMMDKTSSISSKITLGVLTPQKKPSDLATDEIVKQSSEDLVVVKDTMTIGT